MVVHWRYHILRKLIVCGTFAVIFALVFTACAAPPASAPEPSPLVELSRAVRDVSYHLNSNIPAGRMIAFVNVQSGSAELSNFIIDDLIANAVTDRIFTVVDRQRLDYIRAEQNIQLSGEVDDETARSIGSFLGAHTIVSGRVSSFGGYFRLTIRALDVETAEVQGQYNRVIGTERAMTALMGSVPQWLAAAQVQATQPVQTPTLAAQAVQPPVAQALVQAPPAAPPAPVIVQAPEDPPAPITFRIGDIGPAGGIIFFDQGNHSGGWRWLEAAPVAMETAAPWGHTSGALGRGGINTIRATTSREIGAGQTNTQNIMRFFNQHGGGFGLAVQIADEFEINGFDDWFLPSLDELSFMFGNLHRRGLGGFRSEWYYSSTIISMGTTGWYGPGRINFANGEPGQEYSVQQRHRIRAIRRF